MTESEQATELCRSGIYSIVQVFDMAVLVWPKGEMIIGDHGIIEPLCAAMNPEKGWCASGGQGLQIVLFKDGLPQEATEPHPVTRLSLWCNENPPPDGERFWCVADIELCGGDHIRASAASRKGVCNYEINVRTLDWKLL